MPVSSPHRLISVAEFKEITGLAHTTVYRLIAEGKIQKPGRISPKRVAWSSAYIEAWLAERLGDAA